MDQADMFEQVGLPIEEGKIKIVFVKGISHQVSDNNRLCWKGVSETSYLSLSAYYPIYKILSQSLR